MSEVIPRYWMPSGTLTQQHPYGLDDTCVVPDWAYDKLKKDYDQLRAELAARKAGQGETGNAPQCWWVDHGSHGQITQRQDEAESAVREGKRVVRYTAVYTAPPAPADAVSVPRELARRLTSADNHVRQTARRELRVLIYSQEVAP